jgi:streptogramin lyase
MFGRRPAASVLAACLLLLASCASADDPTEGEPPSSASAAATASSRPPLPSVEPSLPAGVARRVDVGEMVYGVVASGGTLWLESDSGMQQLDAETGEVRQTISGYLPMLVDETLWLQDGDRVLGIDPSTGEEVVSYTPPLLGGTAVHDGLLWAVSEETGKLSKVNLEHVEVLGELALPSGEPKAVAFWKGAVWVVIDGSDVVLRVDPESLEVTHTVDGGLRPHSVVVGFGSLWVTEHGRDTLRRIGPTGEVQATITGVGINVAIAVAGESLWAATPYGIAEIDPETNQVVREITLGGGDWYAMAYAQGSLWLTSGEGGFVYQIPV